MVKAGEEILTKRETPRLIAADKVQGTAVYNRTGERLGSIERLMLDKKSGGVIYAVLSFGGVLGMGERHFPLPWQVLTYDERSGGYSIDLEKAVLDNAPSLTPDAAFDWNDPEWGERLHDYYKVLPFWH
jgi:sporulation protein YlmC with PRC-barrel domain